MRAYCACEGSVFCSDDATPIRLEDVGIHWRVLQRPAVVRQHLARLWRCEWCKLVPPAEVRSDLQGWTEEETPTPAPKPLPSGLQRIANSIPATTFHWVVVAVSLICLALGLVGYCMRGW